MDFASPEHAKFRRQLRAWLEANLPDELKVEDAQDRRISPDGETLERRRAWQKMHAGWVGISWPKEYGGRAASFMQQVIFNEKYPRAPDLARPGLDEAVGFDAYSLRYQDQKKRYLPKIHSSNDIWCGATPSHLRPREAPDARPITASILWSSRGPRARISLPAAPSWRAPTLRYRLGAPKHHLFHTCCSL